MSYSSSAHFFQSFYKDQRLIKDKKLEKHIFSTSSILLGFCLRVIIRVTAPNKDACSSLSETVDFSMKTVEKKRSFERGQSKDYACMKIFPFTRKRAVHKVEQHKQNFSVRIREKILYISIHLRLFFSD